MNKQLVRNLLVEDTCVTIRYKDGTTRRAKIKRMDKDPNGIEIRMIALTLVPEGQGFQKNRGEKALLVLFKTEIPGSWRISNTSDMVGID